MTTRIDITIQELQQLQARIDRQQLDEGDWKVFSALVSKLIERALAQQDRLKAKADQQAAQEKSKQNEAGPTGPTNGAEHSPDSVEDTAVTEGSGDCGPRSEDSTGHGEPAGDDSTGQIPELLT